MAWGSSASFSKFAFIFYFSQHLGFVNKQRYCRGNTDISLFSSLCYLSIFPFFVFLFFKYYLLSPVISQARLNEMTHVFLFPFSFSLTRSSPSICLSQHWWLIQTLLFWPVAASATPSGARQEPWEMVALHQWGFECTLSCSSEPADNLPTLYTQFHRMLLFKLFL